MLFQIEQVEKLGDLVPDGITDAVNMAPEAMERAWNISPGSVFGVLVGLQLLFIFYLAWLHRTKDNRLYKLNVDNIEILKDLNTSLLLLKEEGVNMSNDLRQHIDYTREHISSQLKSITNGTEKS